MAHVNSEKTTIYLNPYVKKYIQHRAVEEDSSISEIINDAFVKKVTELGEKAEIAARRREASVSFESILKDMGLTYDDLRD